MLVARGIVHVTTFLNLCRLNCLVSLLAMNLKVMYKLSHIALTLFEPLNPVTMN